jgi:hypothetical protein
MPNGKPFDHPFTDIVTHGRLVYSERADSLVREIAALGGAEEVADLLARDFDVFKNPDVSQLERILTLIRDRLQSDTFGRGAEA